MHRRNDANGKDTDNRQHQKEHGDYCDFVLDEKIDFVVQETSNGYDKQNHEQRRPEEDKEQEEGGSLTAQEKILAGRKQLPIYAYREAFLAAVKDHPVLIVVGETGSGKTTQIPQYLHEIGAYSMCSNELGKQKKIACALSRPVAALSAAARVAQEMSVQVGDEVGYSTTRYENCTSQKTVLQYMTHEMLLSEILTTPRPNLADDYSCIIVDEAQERTLYTDILFVLLRDIVRARRSEMKLIISSDAALDAEKCSKFFDDASIFVIPTRRFPVEIYYTNAPEDDHVDAAIVTTLQIHVSQPLNGDVLVFLTCQEEIAKAADILTRRAGNLSSSIPALVLCPIDANWPFDEQAKIFERTPNGARKVFLAAQTSLPLLDGICYVIDAGLSTRKKFNALSRMESLVVSPISKVEANQRAERAGRTQPGKCFRLYTSWTFEHERDTKRVPEILRIDIINVVLILKGLGIHDVLDFDLMDKPPTDALVSAIEQLYALGALNERGELTKLGRKLAEEFLPDGLSKNGPETIPYALLSPLFFASFVDAMSMMLVPASLFFYVIEQGGSYESYGIVASAFSLSSFSLKLVFGIWSDRTGGRVLNQYLTSFGLAAIGGVVYFFASCTNMPGQFSIALIFLGRLLGGCGAAHITLGYTYFARVLNKKLLTQACTMLHFLRAIGIFLSFAINVMLHKINATVYVGAYAVELTPLNSVGFVLFIANLLVFAVLACHLQEPQDTPRHLGDTFQPSSTNSATLDLASSIRQEDDQVRVVNKSAKFKWRSILRCEILLPIWTCFTLLACFQLVETALTPVVNDALGWGPVGASAMYSGMAALALPGYMVTFEFSRRGARDELLLSFGLVIAFVGYTMMYLLWTHAATPLLFCLPLIVVLEFPLVQAPAYSIYSAVIGNSPALKHHQGFMQAILIMADSVPGLFLPTLIAAFVLRKPQDVAVSNHGRELSPLALYAPILNLITLMAVWSIDCGKRRKGNPSYEAEANVPRVEEMVKLDETVGLLQKVQTV